MRRLLHPATAAAAKPQAAGPAAYYGAFLLVMGLVIRAWLIETYPIIFGGDTVVRLVHRDRILLAYQLPALQAGLHYLALVSEDVKLVQYAMALIGAVAGLAFYQMTADLVNRTAAFHASLLFVSNPFLLALSIVPYQEILMLAGLFFAFHFFFAGRHALCSLSLALACLTRYEAWAAVPVLTVAHALGREKRWIELIRGVALFGWAPLAWILYNRGLAPDGTFVVEAAISPLRLVRYIYLSWITLKNTPIPALLLAALGLWKFWKAGALKQTRVRTLAAFMLLFLASIFFSAHGVSPDQERFVTAREAHLFVSAVVLAVGFALTRLSLLRVFLLAAGVGLGLYGAHRFVARETSDPHVQLSYRLAGYLDAALQENEKAVILARPIPRELIQEYLDKVFRAGGPAALDKARSLLERIDTSPTDYKRTIVHARLGRTRVLSPAAGELSSPEAAAWANAVSVIAVWSDFEPANPTDTGLYKRALSGAAVAVLKAGPISVAVYRVTKESSRPWPVARPDRQDSSGAHRSRRR